MTARSAGRDPDRPETSPSPSLTQARQPRPRTSPSREARDLGLGWVDRVDRRHRRRRLQRLRRTALRRGRRPRRPTRSPASTCSRPSVRGGGVRQRRQRSPRASVTGSTSPCGTSPGLVAAYAFDEGSGTAANDASGNGNNGTITGASWARRTSRRRRSPSTAPTPRSRSAASARSTAAAFTLEAWVQKSSARRTSAIVGTWTGGGPMLWVDHLAGRHYLTLGGSFSTISTRAGPRSSGSGSTWQRRSTARPPATTSTASWWLRARSPAASAARTPGGSAPTAPARVASSTAWSTTSASTAAPSAPARSSSIVTTA